MIKKAFVSLWMVLKLFWKDIEVKKGILFCIAVFIILSGYVAVSFRHIRDPFLYMNLDVNSENSFAAENLMKYGFFTLKFGNYPHILDNPTEAFGRFYAHHPALYLVPTAFLYKWFGVSEFTTRLGPLIAMVTSLCIFTFALRKIANQFFFPLLTLLILCMLPGVIFYGQTFELAIFSVPASLVTFSFFVFYSRTELSSYRWMFYGSIIVGGLSGWFYYFLPATLWLFTLFSKEYKNFRYRKELLWSIPLLLCALFCLNFYHFYILNGASALHMWGAFSERAARVGLSLWKYRVWQVLGFHINEVFMFTAVCGAIASFFYRKKDSYIRAAHIFFLFMTANAVVFTQWMLHPFGVIFVWSVVAMYSAYAISCVIRVHKPIGIAIVILILLIAGYESDKKLDHFYKDLRLINDDDVALWRDMAPYVKDGDVCHPRSFNGIWTTSVVEWYLRKRVVYAPDCFDTDASIGLVLYTPTIDFNMQQIKLFQDHGFKLAKCSGGAYCVMLKEDNSLEANK